MLYIFRDTRDHSEIVVLRYGIIINSHKPYNIIHTQKIAFEERKREKKITPSLLLKCQIDLFASSTQMEEKPEADEHGSHAYTHTRIQPLNAIFGFLLSQRTVQDCSSIYTCNMYSIGEIEVNSSNFSLFISLSTVQ